MKAGVLVYAPHGAGKSAAAELVRRALGLSRVVDEWRPGDPVPNDALVLTNAPPMSGRVERSKRRKQR